MKHTLLHFHEIDSTNTYLKTHYPEGQDGLVVFADHQTEGKGRLGRSWKDNSDALVFSLLLKDHLKEDRISLIPLLSGAAMVRTLQALGFSPSLKWPNDVLLQDRKCCGILVEAISDPNLKAVVIGIGLNLNEASFPQELSKKAISLHQITSKRYNPQDVLNAYLTKFDPLYEDYLKGKDSFLEVVRSHFWLQDRTIYLNYYGENKSGVVRGLTDQGKLLLETNEGREEIEAGEVTLEQNYQKR